MEAEDKKSTLVYETELLPSHLSALCLILRAADGHAESRQAQRSSRSRCRCSLVTISDCFLQQRTSVIQRKAYWAKVLLDVAGVI